MSSAGSAKLLAKAKAPRKRTMTRASEAAPPWGFVLDLGLSKKQLAETDRPQARSALQKRTGQGGEDRVAPRRNGGNPHAGLRLGRRPGAGGRLVSRRADPCFRRPHRRVAGQVRPRLRLARLSRFDCDGRLCVRFRGLAYRAHDPRWSFKPLSGEGGPCTAGASTPRERRRSISRSTR